MDLFLGVNVGLFLFKFLVSFNLNKSVKDFVEFNEWYLFEFYFGEKMGMKFYIDIMGDVIINIGVISYDKEKVGCYGINLRYFEGFKFEDVIDRFRSEINELGFNLEFGKV